MAFKLFVDESDLHFFITKSANDYAKYVKDFNSEAKGIPNQFKISSDKYLKNLELCGQKFVCQGASMIDNGKAIKKDIYVVKGTKNLIPITLIETRVPLEVALIEYAEYFI